VYNDETWRASHPNALPFLLLFFITIATINPDWMHIKYLGVDQYFFGSVLKVLTHHFLPGDPADNMCLVMGHLKTYFKSKKVPNAYKLITVNMYSNKDAPKLKGRAAELRHLGGALLHVFTMLMDNENTLHKNIRLTLKLNVKLEQLLDDCSGWNFKGEEFNKFLQVGHDFCTGYNACADTANRVHGWELFTITIKLHLLLHCVLRSRLLHPKASWCFGGEAFMKVAKQLHSSCTRGLKPHAATVKMTEQMLTALHCQFSGISKE
jgi:hypothetical protein